MVRWQHDWRSGWASLLLHYCVLIAALGAVGIVYPEAIIDSIRVLQAPNALYLSATGRLAFGVVLFFAAPESRAPTTLRAFGVLLIVAGFTMPLLGVDGYQSLVELKLGLLHRVWAISAFLFGVSMSYALVPRSGAAYQTVFAEVLLLGGSAS